MRWIGRCNLICLDWLRVIKLFENNISPANTSRALGLAYNTVLRAFMVLRLGILSNSFDSKEFRRRAGISVDSLLATEQKCQKAEHSPASIVFEIRESTGKVFISVMSRLSPSGVLKSPVAARCVGNLIFAISPRGHKRLFLDVPTYRGRRKSLDVRFKRKRGQDKPDEFVKYIISQFRARRGVLPKTLPLHLKEFEFRFNNPAADLFPLLVEYLCCPIYF